MLTDSSSLPKSINLRLTHTAPTTLNKILGSQEFFKSQLADLKC